VLSFFGVGTNFRRGIYLLIFALAVGVAAIWLGVTASRRARREGMMRPRGALAGTVFGSIGLVLGVILLSMLAAFWSQFNAYSRCLETAQTPSAQQACYSQLTRSVNKVISDLSTGGGG
jgi:zinc transporter ZupT